MSDGKPPLLPAPHAQTQAGSGRLTRKFIADFDRARKGAAERSAGNKGARASDRDGQRTNSTKVSLTDNFDSELYGNGGGDKFAGYNTELPADEEMEDGDDDDDANGGRLIGQYTATAEQIGEWATGEAAEDDILNSREKQAQIQNRETDYQRKRFQRRLSAGGEGKSYKESMQERDLEREEERVNRAIEDKKKDQIARGEDEMDIDEAKPTLKDGAREESPEAKPRRRARKRGWDVDETETETAGEIESNGDGMANGDATEAEGKKKKKSRWDTSAELKDGTSYNALGQLVDAKGNVIKEAEEDEAPKKKSRWDSTAAPAATNGESDAPKRRSKWDVAGPAGGADATSAGVPATPSQQVMPFGTDVNSRNAPISDEELDELLPSEGYQILVPPPGYEPLRAPAKRVAPSATPLPTGGFMNQEPVDARAMGKQLPSEIPGVGDLQFFKNEDMQYFGKLVDGADENDLSVEELKQRKIMRLLLKVKNGTPPMRKTALRQLTDNARNFGAGPLFDQILPLLMEKSLEDQERHLLVKVIDRVLYKLDDLVRPYTHRILVVIEPLLIDQDYYARVEGREIISNLAKAAGLAHMISTMRPDIDHVDEYVRNTTARAFAVVASALGIPTLLPFLKAVCKSKKSWQARHTGVKIVQQIPILMGCAVLPHLKGLVDCIGDNLNDEQTKVRTVTSLALAALAEASNPFGIESFDEILNPLWTGARKQRGKGLAGFLKAVGYIIPLMDEEYSNYYTSQIMEILIREFQSPDEEMKKVVLKVVSQCAGTSGVTAGYLKETVLDDFFKFFWVRRMALDRRNYKQVVETTVDLGNKVGVGEIVDRIVGNLKDESEAYRKMTVETIEKVISAMGAADINERLEERLVDGILHAFQEQSVEDIVLLNGFGTVVNALGTRCKPYLPQIVSTILWRLNNKSATVRQQAADLISRIAVVMKQLSNGDVGLLVLDILDNIVIIYL